MIRSTLILLVLAVLLGAACASAPAATPPPVATATTTTAVTNQSAAVAAPTVRPLRRVLVGSPSPTLGFLPVQVASKLGYFAEEGLEVEYIRAIGTTIVPSLMSGDMHFSTQLTPIGLFAAQGGPARVVQIHAGRLQHVISVRPEITSVSQLAGKRIAVQSLNTITAFEAQKVAEYFNLADVTLLGVGGDLERIAAVEAGAADATVLPIPANLAAERLGFPSLLRIGTVLTVSQAGFATSEAVLRDQPDLARGSLRAAARAFPLVRAGDDRVAPIIAEWIDLPLEDAARAYEQVADTFSPNGISGPADQAAFLELLQATGGMPAGTSPAQVFDFALAQRVAAELGLPAQ
jgi:NitT/TauT family transport system substrate-binding protein